MRTAVCGTGLLPSRSKMDQRQKGTRLVMDQCLRDPTLEVFLEPLVTTDLSTSRTALPGVLDLFK